MEYHFRSDIGKERSRSWETQNKKKGTFERQTQGGYLSAASSVRGRRGHSYWLPYSRGQGIVRRVEWSREESGIYTIRFEAVATLPPTLVRYTLRVTNGQGELLFFETFEGSVRVIRLTPRTPVPEADVHIELTGAIPILDCR